MQFYTRGLPEYSKYIKDPSKKDYVTLAATLGLLLVLLIMLYPAVLHVSSLNKEVSDGTVLKDSLVKKAKQLQTAQNNYNQVKDDISLLNNALPIGSDIKTYLKTPLEDLVAKNSLTLKSIQFLGVPISTPTPEAVLNLRDMEFTASFSGTFTNLNTFLSDLESYIRVTKISGINVFRDTGGLLTMNITAQTNYMDVGVNIIPNAVGGSQ